MKKIITGMLGSVLALTFAGSVFAQPEPSWEIRQTNAGKCVVELSKSSGGPPIAGPYKTKKEAEEELDRLKKGPTCKE